MQVSPSWLPKVDIAILVSVLALFLAFIQAYVQWRRQVQTDKKEHIKEVQEATKQRTVILETMKFMSERLDRVETWISARSGFRGGN
jgi:predicted Holliday junction resolvase-like endonuclease